ncbi:MAG: PASTA domain-containing protein [Muribaculaceae bacterium]|nr:PASTA domain-containing protein [Muribaculaceae bacterium]MDE6009156.1 PASTA domain-containing protein [Muribaculaceae bacterium]
MLQKKNSTDGASGFIGRHPVWANIIVIALVAFLGIWIVYLSLQIFTKHGTTDVVPKVENMSYTQAINILHENGFRVDIRDSIYKEDMKPGFVIEQFPKAGATVKPGRKIFLYINAVHTKEVIIDNDRRPAEDALKGYPPRLGMARLQELGFKNIRVVRVLGESDRILRVIANGKVVKKTQKVPLNARLTLEVQDGRLSTLRDSLQNEELRVYTEEQPVEEPVEEPVTEPDVVETPDEDPEPVFVQ